MPRLFNLPIATISFWVSTPKSAAYALLLITTWDERWELSVAKLGGGGASPREAPTNQAGTEKWCPDGLSGAWPSGMSSSKSVMVYMEYVCQKQDNLCVTIDTHIDINLYNLALYVAIKALFWTYSVAHKLLNLFSSGVLVTLEGSFP